MKVLLHGVMASTVALCTICTMPAQAASRPSRMIAEWTRLNSLCRGGSGEDHRTVEACDARDKLIKQIDKKGWCYGKKAQLGYQFRWHACVSNSNRP